MRLGFSEATAPELIIWLSTAALAALFGFAAAYLLWSHLPPSVSLDILRWALVLGAAGLILLAFGLRNALARVFVIGFALTFALSATLATHVFAALV